MALGCASAAPTDPLGCATVSALRASAVSRAPPLPIRVGPDGDGEGTPLRPLGYEGFSLWSKGGKQERARRSLCPTFRGIAVLRAGFGDEMGIEMQIFQKYRLTMLLNRQKLLLALLHGLGGKATNMDFSKLLFLFCKEAEEPVYEFVPYRYGCFSFTCHADKRKLIQRDFLKDSADHWMLTRNGESVAQTSADRVQGEVIAFLRVKGSLRGEALIAETYRRYPYYASRSRIARDVLKGDFSVMEAIERKRPETGAPGILTLGYEGKSLEAYLNLLLREGVSLLCDVRRNPLSRKYGFSKSTLSNACDGVGIRYEHLPRLGIASESRRNLVSGSDYEALFETYATEQLPELTGELEKIRTWVDEGERVALTCYEHLPEYCHRHCVADALASAFGNAFKPRHL